MTTFSDNSSVDHQIENVYEQAASLFDPNSRLNIEDDEYARGVVELVTRLLGMDSDDKEDVADIISERTGLHRLTKADFATLPGGGDLYIGPLQEAIDFIKGPNATEVVEQKLNNGLYSVQFDGGNVWGTADSQEMAWRLALGAEFGPIDDEFVPFVLFKF